MQLQEIAFKAEGAYGVPNRASRYGRLGTRSRVAGCAVIVIAFMCVSGCSDAASQVNTGVSEKRVRELLGEPSWQVTDGRDIAFWLGNPACAKVSVKMLAYDRWLRRDVLVGINAQGTVACRVGRHLLKE